jgi:DNA-binding beta-propeller fold protein YncE
MKCRLLAPLGAALLAALITTTAQAEILAMLNYESKAKESLKALKLSTGPLRDRAEGIAIMDVDPASANFGKILYDIPLPPDLVAHHIFYNKDLSKAYITALAKSELRVMDMKKFPYRMKVVALPNCLAGEDAVVSDDNKTWYVTCMGTNKVVIGNAVTDTVTGTIASNDKAFIKYPHGIALHNGIDRILVTTTVRASDLKDAGETISVIEASTGKALSTLKVSKKASPGGEAPVEVVFVPHSDPPVAIITNMFGNSLWAAVWDPTKKNFDVQEIADTAPFSGGVPLEIYFSKNMKRMYVTSANPGHLHVFDISGGVLKPKLVKSIATAGGAHHVAIPPDEKLAFVQNSFLNLPGMSDGSISVIDLEKLEVVGTINTFKEQGFNPNLIVLLPEYYNAMGHCNNGPKSCF